MQSAAGRQNVRQIEGREKYRMTRARLDGLYLLVLGSLLFVLVGSFMESSGPGSMADFKGVYYGARCLIQHRDPYRIGEPVRVYLAEGERPIEPTDGLRTILPMATYLPTALLLITPFATLPIGLAQVLWMILTAGSFIFAANLQKYRIQD
jgi:hypothetical protein